MSDDNEDSLDDHEIVDFNEELDARAAQAQEEHDPSEAFGLEMFGPTGRGASPAMGRQSPRDLSRNAATSLGNVGLDETHLKDTTAWDTKVKEPRQQPKVVKAAPRPMVKAKPPRSSKNAELLAKKEAIYDAEVKKLWTMWAKRHGNIPPWYQRKGGTRKRSTRRRGGAYKKRTTRKRMRKHATRRRR
jgi:hypothetical protein